MCALVVGPAEQRETPARHVLRQRGSGGFLSSVATRGLEATLRTFGLSAVVGKGAGAVFAAILDALAPEGALREEAVARKATAEALERLYLDLYGLEDGDLAKLEKMSGAVVSEAVIESVICYIYRLWLEELSIRIEDGALSAAAAVGLERDVADFVRESVKLDLKGSDGLKIDWEGLEGRGLIDRIYQRPTTFWVQQNEVARDRARRRPGFLFAGAIKRRAANISRTRTPGGSLGHLKQTGRNDHPKHRQAAIATCQRSAQSRARGLRS